jgi:hypothetical protein
VIHVEHWRDAATVLERDEPEPFARTVSLSNGSEAEAAADEDR